MGWAIGLEGLFLVIKVVRILCCGLESLFSSLWCTLFHFTVHYFISLYIISFHCVSAVCRASSLIVLLLEISQLVLYK